jgi:probable rRNA maturation factor
MPSSDLARLSLDLQFARFPGAAAHRAALRRASVRAWIAHALRGPAELGLRVVGAEEGRALNLRYRGKDHPTNILTFDYARSPVVMADLVLCAPVVQREAAQQGKSLRAHYAHLVIHGTLHAQGWEHEDNQASALEMEALEILLLAALGFANPY